MKDTKKLNAGIAIMALAFADAQGRANEDQFLKIRVLCERLTNTSLYGDSDNSDEEKIQHAIKLIEEYLEEEVV